MTFTFCPIRSAKTVPAIQAKMARFYVISKKFVGKNQQEQLKSM
jgi:hypothetical protein